MTVDELEIRNFRNIEHSKFQLCSKVNFLLGDNAQGKTSFLEAIYFLATLTSFRTHQLSDLPSKSENSEGTQLQAWLSYESLPTGKWNRSLSTTLSKGKKIARIDSKPYSSGTSYLKHLRQAPMGFHAVSFNPSDHAMIQSDPSERRRYLNQMVSALSTSYLEDLQAYQKVLQARNQLLKTQVLNKNLLDSFTQPLVEIGSRILHFRIRHLERLLPLIQERTHQIAPSQGELSLGYRASFLEGSKDQKILYFSRHTQQYSLQEIERQMLLRLEESRSIELKMGTTWIGPHRDDWFFSLDGKALKSVASQGETRTVLLALKMSEIQDYEIQTGIRPLLLIDDFSSELDSHRRSKLADFLTVSPYQVLITSTEPSPGWAQAWTGRTFHIKHGSVVEMLDH